MGGIEGVAAFGWLARDQPPPAGRSRGRASTASRGDTAALRALVADTRARLAQLSASSRELDAARGRVREISGSIDRVGGIERQADVVALRGLGDGARPIIGVTPYAEAAGFQLSFGNSRLDLADADRQFIMEVGGNLGARMLSFASGTSLEQVVSVINSFTDVTGVVAVGSAFDDGVALLSEGSGSDRFVSVRVVDDGGIERGDGIYDLNPLFRGGVSWRLRSTFSGASAGVRDFGQDAAIPVEPIAVLAAPDGTRASARGVRALAVSDARGVLTLLG
jgi:hypothetical protein